MFIVFEGIDGSGKGTQIKLFKEFLNNKGLDYIFTREPGHTKIGEGLRKVLLDVNTKNMNDLTELLLYAADRNQHINEIIKPALNSNKIVVSDRYYYSTVAYQGYGRGYDMNHINYLNDLICKNYIPDIVFVLDGDIKTLLSRARKRNGIEENEGRFEALDISFFERVRNGYLDMVNKSNNMYIIDANKSIDDIHNDIKEIFFDKYKG